jgi:hypothetical protein
MIMTVKQMSLGLRSAFPKLCLAEIDCIAGESISLGIKSKPLIFGSVFSINTITRSLPGTRGMATPSQSHTPKLITRKVEHFPEKWGYTPDDFKRGDETPVTLLLLLFLG